MIFSLENNRKRKELNFHSKIVAVMEVLQFFDEPVDTLHECSYLEGDVLFVVKRLDARYDWLPSPYKLKPKHSKLQIVSFNDGCRSKAKSSYDNKIVLISREGNCSFFDKASLDCTNSISL